MGKVAVARGDVRDVGASKGSGFQIQVAVELPCGEESGRGEGLSDRPGAIPGWVPGEGGTGKATECTPVSIAEVTGGAAKVLR